MRDSLDIAYVLLVEEMTGPSRPPFAARQQVDELLADPGARARREDQEAMARLMGAAGLGGMGGRR